MLKINIFISKLKNPFNILAISSFILGLISLFKLGPLKTIISMFFVLILLLLFLFTIYRLSNWLESRKAIKFYRNWEEAPIKYGFVNTLPLIGKEKLKLEIIARTCFRLLCGDEYKFEHDEKEFVKNKEEIQQRICNAIISGGSIHIILQNPHVIVPYFSKSDSRLLLEHSEAAIASFEEISNKLSTLQKNNFTISYTDEIIENSMTRLQKGNKTLRFIFDISITFKSKQKISKPFIVFDPMKSEFDDYTKEFEYLLSSATDKDSFNKKKEEGINKIHSIVEDYQRYSLLRMDKSKNLINYAAHIFLLQKHSPLAEKNPPVCIQLLVTNQCTTQCKMCDHFKLYKKDDELKTSDLKAIMDSIGNLGTKAIILSGGEPLYREDLFELIQYAKDKLKLSIGLLTNGIKRGGQFLNKNECNIISEKCSWIQLSIDSFNKDNYKIIRNNDYFDIALKSLTGLIAAGCNKIEICFTIQKDNINELINLKEDIDKLIPRNIPIRFKFAHGPSEGKDFLCSESDLKKFITDTPLYYNGRFNYDYLISMINKQYFDYEGLSEGFPLKKKMIAYESLKYKCHILKMTCKIDANGDVYPCCFLFDDNNNISDFRRDYCIGSLKSPAGTIISPFTNEAQNKLAEIWFENEKLDKLRLKVLPVNKEACSYCTRHFYQNECLNKAYITFQDYTLFGLAEYLAAESPVDSIEPIWI